MSDPPLWASDQGDAYIVPFSVLFTLTTVIVPSALYFYAAHYSSVTSLRGPLLSANCRRSGVCKPTEVLRSTLPLTSFRRTPSHFNYPLALTGCRFATGLQRRFAHRPPSTDVIPSFVRKVTFVIAFARLCSILR